MKILAALKRHKWRYLAIVLGFLLFVGPGAYLIKAVFWLQGSTAVADIHKICFRMPFDWIAGGRLATFDGRYLTIGFLVAVIGVAFVFGPLFCGWLCPVGSSTELLSRPVPKKMKINLQRFISPSALRYGFLASFVAVASLAVFVPSLGLASVCCRFCAASQLQNIVYGIFDSSALQYWHSGAIMTAGAWLLIGGVFWQGGRGWCLYGCPLGAVSNISHVIGSKLGFTFKVKHDASQCNECHKCDSVCPSWSLNRHSKEVDINRHTCTVCLECVKSCPKGCYSYSR